MWKALCLAAMTCLALGAQGPPSPVYVERTSLAAVHLRFPKNHDPARPTPLVVALHGRGATGLALAAIWDVWKDPQVILAVPEGPYASGLGWSWEPTDRELWSRAAPHTLEGILAVVDEVQKRCKVSGVYLLGHSQGVSYAFLAGVGHPDRFKGIVAFAGTYPRRVLPDSDARRAFPALKVFLAGGQQDPVVPMASVQASRQTLEVLGAAVTFREYPVGHELWAEGLQEALEWIEAIEGPRKK
jgi:phospholipase/carboxylesterase